MQYIKIYILLIKLVFASAFLHASDIYLEAHEFNLEMAVGRECQTQSGPKDCVWPSLPTAISRLNSKKIFYDLPIEPIDVVIPCVKKDLETLELCIEGIKKNGKNVRRVIIISSEPFTDKAEWYDEKLFPFSFEDVEFRLYQSPHLIKKYKSKPVYRVGWYFQQLLKLYAPFVIPDISANVLVLDSDTIFLRPVEFLDSKGGGYFNVGEEYWIAYFKHMKSLIPWLHKVYPEYSGISHHMLLQRNILEDLFETICFYHKDKEPWQAFLDCNDYQAFINCVQNDVYYSGASEYELYFNFALSRTNQIKIRPLLWKNISGLNHLDSYREAGYHYVSSHAFMRNP